MRDLWCQLHAPLGEGCSGTAPTDPVTGPGTTGPGTTTNADTGSHESSGCQFGAAPSLGAWWAPLAALAGLVTLWRQRRKASAPGAAKARVHGGAPAAEVSSLTRAS